MLLSKVTTLVTVLLLLPLILYYYGTMDQSSLFGVTEEGLISSSSSSPTNVVAPTLVRPPIKVFLLVGQSNMQGHGYIDTKDDDGSYRNGTLEWMVETDPIRYGKLKDGTTGNWTIRSDTYIAYNKQWIGNVRPEINQYGMLVPGYGGDPGQYQMGPELGFGWTVAEALNPNTNHRYSPDNNTEQILLIKIAWGGRSLAVDFRPPSSGGTTGLYYESMIANTYKTLSRLNELFPGYDDTNYGSYQLSGFAWHQGWNDGCDINMTAEYETNLANLIRDVRTDLNVPNLPVTIGVTGMGGYHPNDRFEALVAAQFAVANATKYPEFNGTVAAVDTRSFLRPPIPDSPGNQIYHWNNNCETYWLIGKAMGEEMMNLLLSRRLPQHQQQEEDGSLAIQ